MLQKFEHQIGGLDKLLLTNDEAVIVKPCNTVEKEFYETSVLYPEFSMWIPKFYGSLQLQVDPLIIRQEIEKQSANVTGVENILWKIKIIYIFRKYLKLGTQLWGEDSSEEKKQKMIKRALMTTSTSLGIKITAFKVYQKSIDNYKDYSREYGYTLKNEDGIILGLRDYFRAEISKDKRSLIIKTIIRDLEELYKALENTELRLYGASLFLVYEGDPDALEEALSKEKENLEKISSKYIDVTDLKIIDFAHSHFRKNVGKDEGCLFGIRNLLGYLDQLLQEN
ncbi:14003_t:CDS:2 [Entrophospora sp. SA101]|nr:14003_t:CDS:2 [Entrophospora sp. SA101]CAJ0824842.1 20087_t:CDS:2 [Entrophospora sp. SA101]CAJ0913150.1 17998_t:CDS:2 [Entrophospora sp. SA101]